jgi:hypothetical protein
MSRRRSTCRERGGGIGPCMRSRQLDDVWGRALSCRVDADGCGFVVFTPGRDGRLGGRGPDADIQRSVRDQIPRK